MSNFATAFAYESGQLLRKVNLRSGLLTVLILAAFGVLVPWMKGFDFLDTRYILAYGSIGLLFAGPLMAELLSVDGGALQAPIVYPARIALVSLYGWGVATLMLAMGFAVVNIQHWFGKILVPPTAVLVSGSVMSLLAAVLVAEVTALLTLKFSAGVAKGVLRLIFLGTLALIVFGPPGFGDALSLAMTTEALPSLAWKVSTVLALLNAGLLVALHTSTKPAADA
ncbi:MAG: hypothetical protein ABI823_03570 [Bryobacteraceae bacterium]